MVYDSIYNGLEIDILRFLRQRVGTTLTPRQIFEGIEGHPTEEEHFTITLNVLIQEGLIDGSVSKSMDTHNIDNISAEGLKALRKQNGPLKFD